MADFKLLRNINLAEMTTFKIGGKADYFVNITNSAQLASVFLWLKESGMPHLIISGGSNTIFDDGTFHGLIIKMDISEFEIIKDTDADVFIRLGSGNNWDEDVEKVVNLGLYGIEALSGIPGSTGASAVQNIGAYGQEVKNTISEVEVFDTKTRQISSLTNAQCKFSYRDSIFKSSQKGRYIITAIVFKLSKQPSSTPKYKDVVNYFKRSGVKSPSIIQIRNAVLDIRKRKFVDPSIAPNAGSFFKNPIVAKEIADNIMLKYPDIKPYPDDTKIFPNPDGTYKIAAGWLIQEAGLKGKELDKVQIDPKHALVLENRGGASQKDLWELIIKVQEDVLSKFGVSLETEPEIIKFPN